MKCSNCEGVAGPDSLMLAKPGDVKNIIPVAIMCENCLKDCLKIKLVVTRTSIPADFEYEQFSALISKV